MSKSEEELITILNQFALIKVGDTFSPTHNTIIDHSTWYSSVSRKYNREDRHTTINYIKLIFEQALEHPSLTNLIKNAILGLQNLQLTYKNDFDTIGAIDTIIQDAKRKMTLQLTDKVDTKYDIFKAIEEKDYTWIENYLYLGNDPHVKNEEGQNVLHLAGQKPYYDSRILNLLISFHVDVLATDENNSTPIYYAVTSGCTDAVLKLEEYKSQMLKKKRDAVIS